jgi:hypothetical protein
VSGLFLSLAPSSFHFSQSAIAIAVNSAIASLALSMTGGGAGTEFSSTVSTKPGVPLEYSVLILSA